MRDDQATGLRRLFEPRTPQVLGVVGGQALPLAIDLACALVHADQRVLMLDRTHGEVAVALGLRARCELRHVLRGDSALRDVVLTTHAQFDLLPAARGLAEIDEGDAACAKVWRGLAPALASYDVLLCNGAPWHAAKDASWLLALAPTTASVTAAYTELKRLARTHGPRRCRVIIEHAKTERAALEAFESVATTARRFLGVELELGGAIVAPRVKTGLPSFVCASAGSPRAEACGRLAELLIEDRATPSRRAVND